MNLVGVAGQALGELQNKRLQTLYQTDFIAWQSDVLGIQTYGKMEEICNTALFGEIPRTAIKSANGTSKSYSVASMILWVGAVHDLGETISIISAPSINQIEKVTFKYLKSHKAKAAKRGFELPGWMSGDLEWVTTGSQGKEYLAYGKKPAPGREVEVFQGIRSEMGKTFVFFDEAGAQGMTKGMWTAAEAVLTGADSRLIAIGNPDNPSAEWLRYFTDKRYEAEFNRFTLSAFDLPTFTGEKVYDDPKMEAQMLGALTQVSWVDHKKRIWGEKDARYQSKVLGEFPEDGGFGFFPIGAVESAFDKEIPYDGAEVIKLGVDIARYGQDESVIYENQGGRIRLVDSWGKTDTVTTARKIHQHANRLGAAEVRIDESGIGGAVFDQLVVLEEFQNKAYVAIALNGAARTNSPTRWANLRAYNHDSMRTQLIAGELDLDFDDTELKDQLMGVTYRFSAQGGIQITPKDEMMTEMGGSPDRLDAAIYSVCDTTWLQTGTINDLPVGSEVSVDPQDHVDEEYFNWGEVGVQM